MPRLYLITMPEGDPLPAVEAALSALPPGAAAVQLRQALPAGALLQRARALKSICTRHAARLFVNDRADVALAAGAGLHLPARGLSPEDALQLGLPVGQSVHSAAEAAASSADFVVFAPVFETPGKHAQGLAALRFVCQAAKVPVLALGGIDASNARACVDAGAAGVACIRSVLGARDPAAAALRLFQALALALLCALPARADDSRYQDYPVGSRAMALGGAFVALSDDPSGLYYNPAGICDTRKLNVNVSASLYGYEQQTRGSIKLGNGSFTLGNLAQVNVIPGEAGILKGVGKLDERGTPFAYGVDVTVPQFRNYGTDATTPFQTHTLVSDRTFNLAAGIGFRATDTLNLGAAVQYQLRLFTTTEDALNVSSSAPDPTVGVYHASANFESGSAVLLVGAKYRLAAGRILPDDEWIFGASLGLPGVPLNNSGQVSVQDVVADPNAAAGSRTTVNIHTSSVSSTTAIPAMMRIGAAWIRPHRWTLSGQITGHLPAHYERFDLGSQPELSQRLRIQDHIDRNAVVDFNLGGEYLLNAEYSLAAGLFTSRTGAPSYKLNADGSLAADSSQLPRVSLYGLTSTLGLIGQHAISRIGVIASYGTGQDAIPNDPTGIVDPTGYRPAEVKQFFLYVYLASTFRY
ncbi:MAG TPA: thiamine phosphate synthase [Myxococcales bacterium]|nr:thiamine phosphate synthase [Myxococcales bacterium]